MTSRGQGRIEGLRSLRDRAFPARRFCGGFGRGRSERLRGFEQFRPFQIIRLGRVAPLLRFAALQLGFQILHPQFQPPDLRRLFDHFGERFFGFGGSDRGSHGDGSILFMVNGLNQS